MKLSFLTQGCFPIHLHIAYMIESMQKGAAAIVASFVDWFWRLGRQWLVYGLACALPKSNEQIAPLLTPQTYLHYFPFKHCSAQFWSKEKEKKMVFSFEVNEHKFIYLGVLSKCYL